VNTLKSATRATVTAVMGPSEKRYAVTSPETTPRGIEDGKSITFSLGSAWHDKYEPQVGQIVLLDDLREYQRGWRALSARAVS